ncbi:MAG TPA: hypothetical protein VF690_20100 [Hymenobacter sp.]
MSSATRQGLQEDGLAVVGLRPHGLSEQDVAGAAHVIALGCNLPQPGVATQTLRHWDGLPSVNEHYALARDEIKKRVEELLDELTKKKSK